MHIAEWNMWIKLSEVKTEEQENGLYRVPTFNNIKMLNGKKYGSFNGFITMTKEEIEEG